MPDPTMITLSLVYTTPSAFWTPRCDLNIRTDAGSVLALHADLNLPPSKAWKDFIVSVSNHSVKLVDYSEQDSRKENVPHQPSSGFVRHIWPFGSSFASCLIVETVSVPDVVVTPVSGSWPWASRLTAKLNRVKARSLPGGDMRITRDGSFGESVRLPIWSPGQILLIDIDIDQHSATALVDFPESLSFERCRMAFLLNPVASERRSSDHCTRSAGTAEGRAGESAYLAGPQMLPSNRARTGPLDEPNNTSVFPGARTPPWPTETGTGNATLSASTDGHSYRENTSPKHRTEEA